MQFFFLRHQEGKLTPDCRHLFWVRQLLLWTSNLRGFLKQYCLLLLGIGALFVPFILLFSWPITFIWDPYFFHEKRHATSSREHLGHYSLIYMKHSPVPRANSPWRPSWTVDFFVPYNSIPHDVNVCWKDFPSERTTWRRGKGET